MMTKNKCLGAANVGLIIGIIIVVIVGIVIFKQSGTESAITTEQPTERAASNTEAADLVEEVMTEDNEPMEPSGTTEDNMEEDKVDTMDDDMSEETHSQAAAQNGVYADFDPTLLANADSGSVVLFFHAGWCPSCRALEKNVESNLSSLPGDVTILVVNYDKETELKKKYGVVRQHTLVQVDASGNKIKTLTGLTNTLDQVLAQI